MSDALRFPPEERQLLLRTPGLGEVIVQRLEAEGIASLAQLRSLGTEHVLDRVGRGAWCNRRRALARALEAAARQGADIAAQADATRTGGPP